MVTVAFVGDSLSDDIGSIYGTGGSLPQRFAALTRVWDGSSVYGGGWYGNWRDEISFSGSWTRATTSDVWDRGPLLGSSAGCGTFRASGATNTATWTRPSGLSVTSMAVWVVDASGAGTFSTRTDGGSWTNISGTFTGSNTLLRLPVSTVPTSTFEVRAANAAGTSTTVYLVGVEAVAAPGVVTIHALGAAAEFSDVLHRTTAGSVTDWWALAAPQWLVAELPFSNDIAFWPASYASRIESWLASVMAFGTRPILWCFPEQGASRSTATQSAMRAAAKTIGANLGIPVVDTSTHWGTYSAAVSAGLLQADELHPTAYGNHRLASLLTGIIAAAHRPNGRISMPV